VRSLARRLATVAILLLSLAAVSPAAAQGPLRERIDSFMRAELARQKVPGVAIGIVKNGKVVLAKGYGFANLEHQVPVGPETLFQSGSLGKQFTAMAVMLQVEAGKLTLADPLTKFFPEAPASWGSITVRHLLNHTSGLPDLEGTLDYRKDYTDEELARFAYALPLEFPPRLALELQQHRLCPPGHHREPGRWHLLRRHPPRSCLQAHGHGDGADHQ
jgi:CubicO group peptidase (beta-lactamase class C family)